jgi:hypothetical protein
MLPRQLKARTVGRPSVADLQAAEVLTVIAEISIALAGFSGIVVAFRQRGIEAWPEHERVRLRFMLGVACVTLLFSLLPFVPHHLAVQHSVTWVFSSTAFSAGLVGVALVAYFGTRAHLNRLSRGWFYTYLIGSVVSALGLLCNGVGVFGPAYPGVYLAGLGWLLFFSTTLFVRLVLSPSLPPGAQDAA